jgi:hypothetical protein
LAIFSPNVFFLKIATTPIFKISRMEPFKVLFYELMMTFSMAQGWVVLLAHTSFCTLLRWPFGYNNWNWQGGVVVVFIKCVAICHLSQTFPLQFAMVTRWLKGNYGGNQPSFYLDILFKNNLLEDKLWWC